MNMLGQSVTNISPLLLWNSIIKNVGHKNLVQSWGIQCPSLRIQPVEKIGYPLVFFPQDA